MARATLDHLGPLAELSESSTPSVPERNVVWVLGTRIKRREIESLQKIKSSSGGEREIEIELVLEREKTFYCGTNFKCQMIFHSGT
jgi:hypothetical protein